MSARAMKSRGQRSIRGVVLVLALPTMILAAPTASVAEDAKLAGAWSQPFWEGGAMPYDPPSLEKSKAFPTAVTAVALPDGRVLFWNGLEGSENATFFFNGENLNWTLENSRSRILDLRTGEPRWTIPTLERGTTDEAQDSPEGSTHDLFCTDQKLLWNGTLLVAGGMEARHLDDLHGDDETRIFDPKTDTFRSVEPMRERRWYPAMVTLPDGRVMVTSGVRQVAKSPLNPEPSSSQVRLSETFDPRTETWQDAGVNGLSLPLYPRLHLLPDGKVFYGGAGQSWAPLGGTGDHTTWALQRLYDPATETWTVPGHSLYGIRNGASSVLLRLEPPYDEAKILIAGGTAGVTQTSVAGTTLSEVVRWTPEGGIQNELPPKAPFAGVAGDPTQLRNPRWYGSPVMLPTGEVLLMNGGDVDDIVVPGTSAAVRAPDLYDPETGTWQEMAAGTRDRLYHNSAVLLPDGSVLVGGNSPVPAYGFRHDNTATRNNNFKDPTFEIYKPPYMFRGPRPVVSSVNAVKDGGVLRLTIGGNGTGRRPAASDISEVVLVRMTAVTHTVDADMRAVKLEHSVAGSTVFAELPDGGDSRLLPPGPYYVFALRNTPGGPVPSMGQTILIQPDGEGRVIARTT